MPCLCPMCCATPSPTWTPQWRLECEARWLLGKPLAYRRDYLAQPAVLRRADALMAEMLRLHRRAAG